MIASEKMKTGQLTSCPFFVGESHDIKAVQVLRQVDTS